MSTDRGEEAATEGDVSEGRRRSGSTLDAGAKTTVTEDQRQKEAACKVEATAKAAQDIAARAAAALAMAGAPTAQRSANRSAARALAAQSCPFTTADADGAACHAGDRCRSRDPAPEWEEDAKNMAAPQVRKASAKAPAKAKSKPASAQAKALVKFRAAPTKPTQGKTAAARARDEAKAARQIAANRYKRLTDAMADNQAERIYETLVQLTRNAQRLECEEQLEMKK